MTRRSDQPTTDKPTTDQPTNDEGRDRTVPPFVISRGHVRWRPVLPAQLPWSATAAELFAQRS